MIETLANGFEHGYDWTVDHDNTAGTVGVTVTGGDGNPLTLHGDLTSSAGVTLRTFTSQRIDQFSGQGRQILYTNAALVGVVLVVPKGQTPPPYHLDLWVTSP